VPRCCREQEQSPIPQGESSCSRKVSEQPLDLVALKVVRLGRSGALGGDRRDLLTDAEHLGLPAGDVVEQRVQHGQALVAGPDVVVATLLQMAEEPEGSFEAQVFESELGDLHLLVGGDEAQKEPDGVPIADLTGGFGSCSMGEHGPRGDVVGAFGPRLGGTVEIGTTPPALQPDQSSRPPEAGQIPDVDPESVLGHRPHTATRAPDEVARRLDGHDHF
jgi:hypothetical protein